VLPQHKGLQDAAAAGPAVDCPHCGRLLAVVVRSYLHLAQHRVRWHGAARLLLLVASWKCCLVAELLRLLHLLLLWLPVRPRLGAARPVL
jgi:hypothetical protein